MPLPLQTPEEACLAWAAAGGASYRFRFASPRARFRELVDTVADMGAGPVAIAVAHDPQCPCQLLRTLPYTSCRCEIVNITLQLVPLPPPAGL